MSSVRLVTLWSPGAAGANRGVRWGRLLRVEHDVLGGVPAPVRAPPHRVAGVPPVGGKNPGEHLERGCPRHLARDPDETWMLLGPDVALRGEEGAKLRGGQQCSVPRHDAGHDLVAGHWVWHAVRCRLCEDRKSTRLNSSHL